MQEQLGIHILLGTIQVLAANEHMHKGNHSEFSAFQLPLLKKQPVSLPSHKYLIE